MPTRKTLKDFLDSPNYPKSETVEDDKILRYKLDYDGLPTRFAREEQDDLTEEIKETLSSYTKYIVDNANNIYKPNSTDYEQAVYYRRGDPELETNDSNYDVYITDQEEPNLERSSSEYLETNLILDKTGAEKEKSGHTVLSKVNNEATGVDNSGNATPFKRPHVFNSVVHATQKMMLDNNRFANAPNATNFTGDKYISPDDFENNEELEEGSILIENVFGEHTKENKVKLGKLKDLGASLLYRTSGFSKVSDLWSGGRVGEVEDIENSINEENYSGNKYSDDELLTKQNRNTYRAKYGIRSIFEQISDDIHNASLRAGRGDFFNQNAETYGQTYNPEYEFLGKNQKIQKIQLVLALRLIFKLYDESANSILNLLDESSDSTTGGIAEPTNVSVGGPFLLGTNSKKMATRMRWFAENAMVRTLFPYRECVSRGLMVCFGDREGYDQKELSAQGGTTGIKSSGFWLAVVNTVLKRAAEDFDRIKLLTEAGNINDWSLEYWELQFNNYRDNPVLKFFNSMATIGDISFKAFQGGSVNSDPSSIVYPRDPDMLPDLPGNRAGKSRKRKGNRLNQLHWGQNEVPSAYLLPMNVIQAAAKLERGPGSPNPLRGVIGSELVENVYMGLDTEGSGNRIPAEAVKAMEDRLDAEYVPLYIQDLRTNEIISFHAFINNLSDNFSTNYTSTHGYGRLDQVKTYDNTTRSINCDFTLVATSKEDFNTMWYKINKLVTLIYPQWTQGTRVADEIGNVFIQPHSQVIGATPVVRLRVGDVVKSNYSKFNFARIFGIGDRGIKAKRYSKKDKKAASSEQFNMFQRGEFEKDGNLISKENLMLLMTDNADVVKENTIRTLIAFYGSPLQYSRLAEDIVSNALEESFAKRDNSGNIIKEEGETAVIANVGNRQTGNTDTSSVPAPAEEVVKEAVKQPSALQNKLGSLATEAMTEFLKNGFVNPIASLTTFYQIQDPSLALENANGLFENSSFDLTGLVESGIDAARLGYVPGTTTLLLKGNMNEGYLKDDGSGRVYTQRPIRVMVTSLRMIKDNTDQENQITKRKMNSQTTGRTTYKVKIVDGTLLGEGSVFGKALIVSHEDLLPLPSAVFFNTVGASALSGLARGFPEAVADVAKNTLADVLGNAGLGSAVGQTMDFMNASGENMFMDSGNNPFVKAYESTRGRGLAGVIEGFSFNWYDENTPWETDFNSRAPKACKISIKLSVIHDIPPGLDHSGFNRAPLYNVGDIMKEFSGDVYDDDAVAAEFRYKKGTSIIKNYNSGDE